MRDTETGSHDVKSVFVVYTLLPLVQCAVNAFVSLFNIELHTKLMCKYVCIRVYNSFYIEMKRLLDV